MKTRNYINETAEQWVSSIYPPLQGQDREMLKLAFTSGYLTCQIDMQKETRPPYTPEAPTRVNPIFDNILKSMKP